MYRPYNFSAGPAALPLEVLSQAAIEMLNWHESGMGVMEMSHRGKDFGEIYQTAQNDLRELLAIPVDFSILFMQGGGIAENAIVPLNLSYGESADFVLTGAWSEKSHQEAGKYCNAHIAASSIECNYTQCPPVSTWQLYSKSRYIHVCTNETIHGVEFQDLPDLKSLGCDVPLVIDFSSHVASRQIDWSRVGLAFGGAQKNLGPAGLTLVVVRNDLLGHALPICPSAFDYQNAAKNQSMFNTPPTYSIYIAGLVFQWLKRQKEADCVGIAAMELRNQAKAQLLYSTIDASSFYSNPVAADCRSRMNIPFFLQDSSRNEDFLSGAKAQGLLQLKGHKAIGGMRASLYNAMPIEGVKALVSYMQEFEQKHA